MIAAVLALVFAMPSSWQHVALDNPPGSSVEMLDIGRGPIVQGFQEQINVLRHRLSDPSIDIETWGAQSAKYLQDHDSNVIVSHAERVCNGTQDGWTIESSGSYSGRSLHLVQTALLDGEYEYVATYSRLEGTPADAAAVKALDTLCPKGEAN